MVYFLGPIMFQIMKFLSMKKIFVAGKESSPECSVNLCKHHAACV